MNVQLKRNIIQMSLLTHSTHVTIDGLRRYLGPAIPTLSHTTSTRLFSFLLDILHDLWTNCWERCLTGLLGVLQVVVFDVLVQTLLNIRVTDKISLRDTENW